MRKDIQKLTVTYTAALREHGATPKGVLWPNAPDLGARFETLLGGIDFDRYRPTNRIRLLDLGCGPGLLLDYLAANTLLDRVDYTGVDVLEAALDEAQSRWPQQKFELHDARDQPFPANHFDYCIACGVFTGRFELSATEMTAMAQDTLKAVWPSVTIGLAFNAMSKHVDWERDDLFHWPLDDIMAFCKADLSRHVRLRLDYGLWEVSTIVLKSPAARLGSVPVGWRSEAS